MIHQPVLVREIIEIFRPGDNDALLDLTLGHGGHTAAYLTAGGPRSRAVGLDADPQTIAVARQQLAEFNGQVTFLNGNFAYLNDALMGGGIVEPPDNLFSHILLDLGVGSHQLADTTRGFSFQQGLNLTMAFGPLKKLPPADFAPLNQLTAYLGRYPDATDIIREMAVTDLARLIRTYGQERYAGRIAVALKRLPPPLTARPLAAAIAAAVFPRYAGSRINPATRTFQALRLAVNRELEALSFVLPQALEHARPAGLLAVISFHSLEDGIVKRCFRQSRNLAVLTKKPIRPSPMEIESNPRSRSAKLRVARRG